MIRELLGKWKKDFYGAFDRVEHQSQRWIDAHRRQVDWPIVGLIIVACIVLACLEYWGGSGDYHTLEAPLGVVFDDAAQRVRYTFGDSDYGRLAQLMYWSGCTFVGYLLIPALYVKLVMGRRLREFGFNVAGALEHCWIYIGLFLAIIPVVFAASFTDSFQHTYPFYEYADRSWLDFVLWELTYIVQFLSLEFFFRGFLIHGLKRRFGVYAVLMSVVPYCMIHFGKPFPETLGAIVAGIALGMLSLYTRSIWLGVAIHVSVAVSMDTFSLLTQGKLNLF